MGEVTNWRQTIPGKDTDGPRRLVVPPVASGGPGRPHNVSRQRTLQREPAAFAGSSATDNGTATATVDPYFQIAPDSTYASQYNLQFSPGISQTPPVASNHEGLWWASPRDSESGWGINFAHQGDVIFATCFTYDATGKAWWLFSVAAETAVPNVYSGLVKTATGPAFNAVPFDSNAVVRTTVGNATITFADGNHARFDYTVNGVVQSKNLTRQVFAQPGTVCQ
jgi:hypothetical protein